jgi:hypothetical protein
VFRYSVGSTIIRIGTPRARVDHRVGVPLIGDPVHDHVDLLHLVVVAADRAVREVLARREVQFRVDRVGREVPRLVGDVAVGGVAGVVHPRVVELGLEAVHDRRVVRVIHRLVDVVDVGGDGNERVRAEIRRAEIDGPLLREDHRLPVLDPAGNALAHRNARIFQLQHDLLVDRMADVRARVHQDAHLHAGVEAADDRVREARILHEPHADVDLFRFGVDHVEQLSPAVGDGRIAQQLESRGAGRQAEQAEREKEHVKGSKRS